MTGAVLLLGFLLSTGEVEPHPEIVCVRFDTISQCEQAASHTAVYGSYQVAFPNADVILYCAEINP